MHAWDCPCGARNGAEFRYCHNCGAAAAVGRAPSVARKEPPPRVPDAMVWDCHCGNVNPLSAPFCSRCGGIGPTQAYSAPPPQAARPGPSPLGLTVIGGLLILGAWAGSLDGAGFSAWNQWMIGVGSVLAVAGLILMAAQK